MQANSHGTTVFIEHDKHNALSSVKNVFSKLQAGTVTLAGVEYNTSVSEADDFFDDGPWSLELPAEVADLCYDVYILDGPPGHTRDDPGTFFHRK